MKPTTCKHYSGTVNKHCRAGVCYDDVTPNPDEPGSALRMPCHTVPWDNRPVSLKEHAKRGTCEKLELPTRAELKADEERINQIVADFQKSQSGIAEVKRDHKGENWQGTVECPVCKGVLHMGHVAYNGHTRGRCETTDCLNWIE